MTETQADPRGTVGCVVPSYPQIQNNSPRDAVCASCRQTGALRAWASKAIIDRVADDPEKALTRMQTGEVRNVIRWLNWMVGGISHRHYKHPSKPNVVTIPGHLGDELPKGTLKSIFRAAGLEAKS